MARPRLGDSESKRLQMVITEDELAAIDEWQHANKVASRSEAIRRLCRVGMELEIWANSMGDMIRRAGLWVDAGRHQYNEAIKRGAPEEELIGILNETTLKAQTGLMALTIDDVYVTSFLEHMKSGTSVEEAIKAAEERQQELNQNLDYMLIEGAEE
jgi:hypothetical protein